MLSLLGCNKTQEIASLKITIEGAVYDYATNSLIAEATVTLNTSGNTYTATTDEFGFFSLGDFPAGSYTKNRLPDRFIRDSKRRREYNRLYRKCCCESNVSIISIERVY